MARVPSTMLALGTPLPEFSLIDTVSGRSVGSDDLRGSVALLMVLCNHCPFVKHVRQGISELSREYVDRGVAVVGISANDIERFPQDGPEAMATEAREAGYVFPYCYDASQELARALRAACTPEFYVFDRDGRLRYRGQMDDSRPGNGVPVTGADLRRALDDVLGGQTPDENQKPSVGCNIKWKPGNEPDYFR